MRHLLLPLLLLQLCSAVVAQDTIPLRRRSNLPAARRPESRRQSMLPATPDADGRHVNAHGGCIIAWGDEWLWYGEARPDRGFTSEGVSLYTAPRGGSDAVVPDSLVWQNRGLVLTVSDDAGSPIGRGCIIERPKVVWNPRTKLFVMLFHSELKGRGYEAAQTGFATSPSPYGPFTFHHARRPNAGLWPADFGAADIQRAEALREADYPEWWTPSWREAVVAGLLLKKDVPQGQMTRDMTVFVDDDGTAWHIYSSEENLTLQAAELTPDYLGYTGRYFRIAAGGQNEAPCILKRDGLYWLICSGCTGWTPNEARMFSAPAISGPWTQHPSPMRGPDAERTFGGQGTWLWQYAPGRYFFMADVWLPRSLSQSRHLFLPVAFEADGTPVVGRR